MMQTIWSLVRAGLIPALFCVSGAAMAQERGGSAARTNPSVLELFTSQGCSSCPPADKLIAELSRNPDILVLTLPVDYWDYLGWADTLAKPDHTARQKAYALARGDRKVFTPQIVVNGVGYAIGNDRAAVLDKMAKTAGTPGLLRLKIEMRERDGQIEVKVPAAEGMPQGEAWLIAYVRKREVAVDQGENARRSAHYVNVVREMTWLGTWKGKASHFHAARAEAVPAEADAYVAVVQAGTGSKPGVIMGMAR